MIYEKISIVNHRVFRPKDPKRNLRLVTTESNKEVFDTASGKIVHTETKTWTNVHKVEPDSGAKLVSVDSSWITEIILPVIMDNLEALGFEEIDADFECDQLKPEKA
jgi:hypothetical protein